MRVVHRVEWLWVAGFVAQTFLSVNAFAQETRKLEGHPASIYAVQTSRDGKTVLSGDIAGTLIGWDWETQKPLQRYQLGDRAILNLAVSPDSRQFAACAANGKVYLGDVPLRNFFGLTANPAPGVVASFAFTADGRFLLEGDQASYIRIWDAATGAHIRDIGGAGVVTAIGLDPLQPHVLASATDGMVRGWNYETAQPVGGIQTSPLKGMIVVPGETTRLVTLGDDGSLKLMNWPAVPPKNLQGHSNQVAGVAVSPDGKWILTGGLDQQVNLSKSEDGSFVRSFPGQTGPTTAVAFNAASTLAAAASQTGTIKFWNVADGADHGVLTGHTGAVFDIAFHAERNEIVSAGNDATIRVWTVPAPATSWAGAAGTIAEIVSSSKGEFLASVGADKAIRLWNPATGALTKTLDGFEQPLTAVALSADDQWIAAGDAAGQIHLRKPDGTAGGVRKAYDGAIGKLVWKPDSKQIVACGSDGKVKSFAVPFTDAAEPLKVIDADTVRIYSLAQSKDGTQLFTAGEDKLVKLWNADGQMARQFGPYPNPVRRLDLSADGTMIAAVGDPSGGQTHVHIWNVADGAVIRDLDSGVGVTGGNFLPDGSFAVYGADRKARRYELKTPLLLEIVEFPTPITAGLSLGDGQTLISGGADNKLYRQQYTLKQYLVGHTGPVRAVAFDQDNVLSGGDDSTARRWNVTDRTVLQTFAGHAGAVYDIALNDTQIATVSADTNLRCFPRAKTPEQLAVKDVPATTTIKHPAVLRSVASHGPQFITGGDDSLLRRWEPPLGELERLPGQAGQILSIAALPDGRLVSGASDNTARLWSPAVTEVHTIGSAQGVKLAGSTDGKQLTVLGRGPAGMPDRLSVWSVEKNLAKTSGPLDLPAATDFAAIQLEAGLIALGSAAELSLWSLPDLKKLTAVTLPAPVGGIVFSHQGKRLTAASGTTLVHYDLAKKGEAVELTLLHDTVVHPNNVVALAIAPDDRTLLTAAQDNAVRKFQSASPVPRKILSAGAGPVYSAAYSADGRWLATGGADRTLRLWNVATGQIAAQSELAGAINQVAFSAAGDLLLTGGEDGSVRIWQVAVPQPAANTPPVPAEKLTAKLEPLQEWKCVDGETPLPVRSVIFSTDINWVLAGTSRGPIFVWKTKEPMAEPVKLESHNSAVTGLRYNLANNRLASFDSSGHATIWNPGNWAYLAFQHFPAGTAGAGGAYALDGITWIVGDRKGTVVLPPVAPAGR